MEQRSKQISRERGVLLFQEIPELEAIERGARQSLQNVELIRGEIDALLPHVFRSPVEARTALEEARAQDRSAAAEMIAREPGRFGVLRQTPVRGRFGMRALLGFTSDQEARECALTMSRWLRDLAGAEDHAAGLKRRIGRGPALVGAAAILQEVRTRLNAVRRRQVELDAELARLPR